MTKIILPHGVKVGHYNSDTSGTSVILCEDGFDTCGSDVRGAAPGTRETDLTRPEKAIERLNAVVFSGGSAYGLDACSGVMRYLKERNCGHKMGPLVVPIVAGAVIFDLNKCGYNTPNSSFGYDACKDAKQEGFLLGRVGVGKGATVGKILGQEHSCDGGFGGSTIMSNGLFVTALTIVNALGDVYDKDSGEIVCGAKLQSGQFLNTSRFIMSGNFASLVKGGNTTLTCILTNAKLSKIQANKLASIAHDGMALAIRPVHTDYDGDTVFAVSKGEVEADMTMLSVMTVEAVAASIINAVKH